MINEQCCDNVFNSWKEFLWLFALFLDKTHFSLSLREKIETKKTKGKIKGVEKGKYNICEILKKNISRESNGTEN